MTEIITIQHIDYPFVFLSNGERVRVSDFKESPRVGATVTKTVDGMYAIKGVSNDSDCVNGVCPIK